MCENDLPSGNGCPGFGRDTVECNTNECASKTQLTKNYEIAFLVAVV